MKKRTILYILFVSYVGSFHAQQQASVEKKAPKSIYTFSSYTEDRNSFSSLNKRLGLGSFEMQWTYRLDSDLNPMPVEFKNMSKKPIIFQLDDYQRYQNNKFIREISYKNDPTRWNLHCIQNRIQPELLAQ